jgi:muconate cycloisomerase
VRVAELTAYHTRIPLRRRIRHASHTRYDSDNVLIRCVLADGTEGFGEGVPRDYVTGETIDSSLDLLRRSQVGDQLESCPDFAHAVAVIERLRLQPVPGDERGCEGNAARCAVELALLDVYGKHFKEPVSTVTKLLAPDMFQARDWVRYSGAITSAKGFKARLAARWQWVWRFQQVKVKVGIADQDDAARMRSIRSILGYKRDIRVDANEAWQPENVVERIRHLEPFQITSVEQPVSHDHVDVLTEVRRHIHTPLMLDESLCSRYDAERAVDRGSCDLFNIRLSKCGGYIPSLRLAQFAQSHGIGFQLGCQIGESAWLSAAGRHFATSVASLRYLEGSYDRHLVQESLVKRDITFHWGGWAPALVGPGLGVDIDGEALARVSVRKESLLG